MNTWDCPDCGVAMTCRPNPKPTDPPGVDVWEQWCDPCQKYGRWTPAQIEALKS